MYSNRQAYENPFNHGHVSDNQFKTASKQNENTFIVPIYDKDSIVYTNHLLIKSLTTLNPGLMFLVPLIALSVLKVKESLI
jgi:hypothetical protein